MSLSSSCSCFFFLSKASIPCPIPSPLLLSPRLPWSRPSPRTRVATRQRHSTHRNFPACEQSASRVLYCFTSSVGDQLLRYIRDAKTPKEAWGNLKKIFAASTTNRKLQLRQELSNVRQRDMLMVDYASMIKDICDSLTSINLTVEEDEMMQVCR